MSSNVEVGILSKGVDCQIDFATGGRKAIGVDVALLTDDAPIEDIVAVEGIDGILIGPGDLSISVRQNRHPDAYGPDTIDVVKHVFAATKAAGKRATAFAMVPEHANMLAELGANMISIGVDDTYVDKGVAMHVDQLNFL